MALNKQVTDEDIIINRIKVIRGHLAGVEKMILSHKPHKDILTQLSAISSAMHKVAVLEAREYLESALNEETANKPNINDAIDKLMELKLYSFPIKA